MPIFSRREAGFIVFEDGGTDGSGTDAGDKIIFDYTPEDGTSIFVKGQKKGTIPGQDFMNAVYTIYLGPAPASSNLKEALLGVN